MRYCIKIYEIYLRDRLFTLFFGFNDHRLNYLLHILLTKRKNYNLIVYLLHEYLITVIVSLINISVSSRMWTLGML